MCGVLSLLPWCSVCVGLLCLVLQCVVLPSDHWGHFVTRRTTRGVREERGHFGLWRLCSGRGGEEAASCSHPEDAPYRLPTHAGAAGAVSVLHLLLVASFVCLALVRVVQVWREAPDLYLGTRRLCLVKVAIALAAVILSITVSILASVGEGRFRQFNVFKGWASWIQMAVVSLDIVLLLVCAFENIQYWQVRMSEPPPPDPTDLYPETFVAPDYEPVVYVRDAGVQSELQHLKVPDAMYGRRDPGESELRRGGATVVTLRDSPHPRKKNTAHPTRVI